MQSKTGIDWSVRVAVADLPNVIADDLEEAWEFNGIESQTHLLLEEVFDKFLEWNGIIGYTPHVQALAEAAHAAQEGRE